MAAAAGRGTTMGRGDGVVTDAACPTFSAGGLESRHRTIQAMRPGQGKPRMKPRRLGQTGMEVSPLGFGAFKIGRNQGTKYAADYELPGDEQVNTLVAGLLAMGVTLCDTAPAYGCSESRLGQGLDQYDASPVVSTKVGEEFLNGQSTYDYSEESTRRSVIRSCERLHREMLDVVLVHSHGDDLSILRETTVVRTLQALKDEGRIRAVGFSGKTVEGAKAALEWADVLMVEYHAEDRSHHDVISAASDRGVGVLVKKGLASGRLPADEAIAFVLGHPGVSSLVIGTLSLDHFAANIEAVE